MAKVKNRNDSTSARYGAVARIPWDDVNRARAWLTQRAKKDATITPADIEGISVAGLFRRLVNFAEASHR